MYFVRIDNRLIHGQIIEAWLPFTGADTLVVANDDLAEDDLRQEIMAMAVPNGVELVFFSVEAVGAAIEEKTISGALPNILVLLADCKDAKRAHQHGLPLGELNIGNLHYAPGKRQICAHISVSSEDEACLRYFSDKDVALDYRCVPNDQTQVRVI